MNVTAGPETILSDDDQTHLAAVSDVEDGIRDFVKDGAFLRRATSVVAPISQSALEQPPEIVVSNVNALIQRAAGASIAEIQNLTSELETLRELLHAEGHRVQREILGYAEFGGAAMNSTRLLAESVAQWRGAAEELRNS
jgi:hypothetical protein